MELKIFYISPRIPLVTIGLKVGKHFTFGL